MANWGEAFNGAGGSREVTGFREARVAQGGGLEGEDGGGLIKGHAIQKLSEAGH
jgi:hypothetical protein